MVFKDTKQITMLDQEPDTTDQPVTCLGMAFADDEARRAYFTEELRKRLPELRQMEGFPIGEDEDILALSDPPYYTACPNPFIKDFIRHHGKPYNPAKDSYRRLPFAVDVSEGKNDPIYNAHSYHTKVPHKAIMRYILHYTEPGDIVFDGFCGTGMTGVAAHLCGDKTIVESLGYKVDRDGTIYQQETNEHEKESRKAFSRLGSRVTVLNDLSPCATFISHNYNKWVNVSESEQEMWLIHKSVQEQCGWMYETFHTGGKMKGMINFTLWSDVFICPECTQEIVFWSAAADKVAGKVKDEFNCPYCNNSLNKRRMDRAWVTQFDKSINQTIRQAKQVPVLINYSVGKQRYEKAPDEFDLALMEKIEQADITYWFPNKQMQKGFNTEQPKVSHGITHAHHFYTKRNLWTVAAIWSEIQKSKYSLCDFLFTSFLPWTCRTNRFIVSNYFNKKGGVIAPNLPGTLYVSSLSVETNPLERFKLRVKSSRYTACGSIYIVSTESAAGFKRVPEESVDYIFTDPPFGGNLMYSELNFLTEAWLRVSSNPAEEAIVNNIQGKNVADYLRLMEQSLRAYYHILKPGRWITVEFHNSQNAIWNCIQEALTRVGFVISDVSVLEKTHKTFKQVTSTNAVNKDLAITAYKPNGGLEERFKLEAGTEESAWDFVRTHLMQLPVFLSKDGQAEVIAERQNYLLFDRMVAFHIQRGATVPLSAAEFYAGLVRRFPERDGMYFLPDQVAEYDKKRLTVQEISQLQFFVTDEFSAIQWLKQQLVRKPQTFQEIHPLFFKEISGWHKYEKPLELSELLEQNFLRYDGNDELPSQIHSYLSTNFKDLRKLAKDDETLRSRGKDRWYVPDPNKQADLEKLREKSLLREFASYIEEIKKSKRKLKQFRTEAIRAGFRKAWGDSDYQTIVEIGRRLPESILQEDDKLLMYYDNAQIRLGM